MNRSSQSGARTFWLGLVVSLILPIGGSFNTLAQSPSFPMNHWVYPLLDRLQAEGMIHDFLAGTQPYSRSQIAAAVAPLLLDAEQLKKLNSTEQEQLNYLRSELKEELMIWHVEVENARAPRLDYLRNRTFLRHLLPDFVFNNGRNLLSITQDGLRLYGDFVLYENLHLVRNSYLKNRDIQQERHGITLWGSWSPWVQFYFDFRDASETGGVYPASADNWSFERVGYAKAKGNSVSFDETTCGIFAGHGFWQIMIGKEKNRWGPGRFGSLMLSDWATSYDQFKLQLHWRRLQFTALTGFLRSYPSITPYQYSTGGFWRTIAASKYLAAHRLEFMPARRVTIGLQETLIYGERNLELAYVNPINFYWSAGHYFGDQDNSTIGADCSWYPGRRLKLYGELLIDDLQTGRLQSDWYGNKWGILAGFSNFDLVGIDNLDFHFEWSRIRPYVYTHTFPINVYKHFTSTLGHWSGPNSETVTAELDYRWSKYLLLQAGFEFWRHGANPADQNVGGDMNLPHRPGDANEQKSFAGVLEKSQKEYFKVSYELFRNAYLNLEYARRLVTNWLNDQGQRVNGAGNEWQLIFSWNY